MSVHFGLLLSETRPLAYLVVAWTAMSKESRLWSIHSKSEKIFSYSFRTLLVLFSYPFGTLSVRFLVPFFGTLFVLFLVPFLVPFSYPFWYPFRYPFRTFFGTFFLFLNLLTSAYIGRNNKPTRQSCDQQSREHVPNPNEYSMWGRRRPAKIGEVLVNGLTLHYYFLPQKYIIQLVRSLRTSPQWDQFCTPWSEDQRTEDGTCPNMDVHHPRVDILNHKLKTRLYRTQLVACLLKQTLPTENAYAGILQGYHKCTQKSEHSAALKLRQDLSRPKPRHNERGYLS